MTALAHHAVLRLKDDRVLASTTAARRRLARAVLEAARPFELLAFRAADTHLHLLAAGSRAETAELARRAAITVRRRGAAGVAFAPARIVPVRDQAHLRSSFWYVLRQEERHGLEADPFHEASNLPDLVGLRFVGARTVATARALLPRVRREALDELLGLDRAAEPRGWARLPEAVAAVACVSALRMRQRCVTAAKIAATHLASPALAAPTLATLLQANPRTVVRWRGAEADPGLVRAVDLQLRLRASGRHASGPLPPPA